ncbi:hypothetical protein ACFXPI_04405 [Streptomyces sp. NPDC059104]|uniref:hypothetical protein n=1 Tax=Streptomyces sp. NPDC059104 TaxID=3346729 RepID=UPI0036A83D68
MTPVLDQLGEKLAEKWVSALALPGLLFVGASACAAVLGQDHALDLGLLIEKARHWAATVAHRPVVGQVTAVAVALLVAVAMGMFVRVCGEGAARVWTGDWPRPARRLARRVTARRAGLWGDLQRQIDGIRRDNPPYDRDDAHLRQITDLTARRDRMGLSSPARPTYTGDRFAGVDGRLRGQYGIDLAACWPGLWLVLPEEVRAELRTTRARFDAEVAGSVWACCYLVLGCFWWPAAVGGAAAGLVAWRRGRRAAAAHAGLAEAAVDVHLRRLAEEVGIALPPGPTWDPRVGLLLNRLFRKGA